jgi:hypothetical protein
MFLKGLTSSTKKTFLSRLLHPSAQKSFSNTAIQAFVNATANTDAAES